MAQQLFKHLTTRWPHVVLTFVLLVGFSPTPIAHPVATSLRSAKVAIEGNRLDVAVELLESAMAFEPALGALHLQAAEIALAADKPQKTLDHLDAAASLYLPNNANSCLSKHAHLALGNISEIVDNIEYIIRTCSVPTQFLQDLAQAYLNEDNPLVAQSLLKKLSSIKPSDPNITFSLAIVTATIKPDEALAHLRQVNSLTANGNPLSIELINTIEDAAYYSDLSYSLAQVGQALARYSKWTPAAWAFQHALELDPEYIEVRAYFGLALDRAGKDGLRELEAAINATPSAVLPRIFIAQHWLAQDQPQKAKQQLEIAARLDPENPAVSAELGAVYAALGDVRSAINAYRFATELAPDNPSFWLLLAQFSLNNEIEVQSLGLAAARNSVALNPDDHAALDILGYAHVLLNNLVLADRLLSRAVDLQPHRAATQLHLGLLRHAQGETNLAQAALEMALMLDPDGNIGQMAKRILTSSYP